MHILHVSVTTSPFRLRVMASNVTAALAFMSVKLQGYRNALVSICALFTTDLLGFMCLNIILNSDSKIILWMTPRSLAPSSAQAVTPAASSSLSLASPDQVDSMSPIFTFYDCVVSMYIFQHALQFNSFSYGMACFPCVIMKVSCATRNTYFFNC